MFKSASDITLILAITQQHCCVHGSWGCEKWETDIVLWTITWKVEENTRNLTAYQVIRGCAGSEAINWFPHSSNPTLGLREDMHLFLWRQQETHVSMVQSFFLWSCHNTQRKLILCLTSEWAYYNLQKSTGLLSTSSHTDCIVIIQTEVQCMLCFQETKNRGYTNLVPTKTFF